MTQGMPTLDTLHSLSRGEQACPSQGNLAGTSSTFMKKACSYLAVRMTSFVNLILIQVQNANHGEKLIVTSCPSQLTQSSITTNNADILLSFNDSEVSPLKPQ